jgi:chemotaxis protein histidine kinase CheA
MNRTLLTAVAAAIGLAFGTSAFADTMTKPEYKAAQENIKAGYMSAAAACEPFVANAKDICLAEAKGKEGVQLAELKEKNHPGRKAHYYVRIAIADSEYGSAKEKCDDMAGNAKDVCVKEAKAAQTAAKADAVAQRKVTAANKTAKDKTVKARSEAHEKIVDAKQDAAAEKNNAEYKVAIEKCDALAGNLKEVCVHDAKMHYGKS